MNEDGDPMRSDPRVITIRRERRPDHLAVGPRRRHDTCTPGVTPALMSVDTILIVDRDAGFCRHLADALTSTGYTAIWTTDPSHAARLIARQIFALVVIDEALPLVTAGIDPFLPILRLRGDDGEVAASPSGVQIVERAVGRHDLLAHVRTRARS
jgi:CheY-like chemotaxis protein